MQDEHAKNMAEIKSIIASLNSQTQQNLAARQSEIPITQSNVAPPLMEQSKATLISENEGTTSVRKMSRWNQFAGAGAVADNSVPASTAREEAGSSIIEVDFQAKPKEVQKPSTPRNVASVAKTAMIVKDVASKKAVKPAVIENAKDVIIHFSRKFNESLVDHNIEGISVSVPRY